MCLRVRVRIDYYDQTDGEQGTASVFARANIELLPWQARDLV